MKNERKAAIPLVLNISFDNLRNVILRGVHRAAAFLSIGLNATENYVPASLSLSRHTNIRFFPEPLPQPTATEAVKEFHAWLIGNALRELDMCFGLFLDQVARTVKLSKLHGTRVRTDYVVGRISGETNVASKLKTVMKELGEPEPDVSGLWSLSNARNCLSHSGGVVTPRHAKSDGALVIRWIAFEPRLVQGEQQIIIPPVFDELRAPDPSKEADIVLVVVEREMRFAIGQKIRLDPHDLHEICIYYWRLTEQVLERLSADLKARGIEPRAKTSRSLLRSDGAFVRWTRG